MATHSCILAGRIPWTEEPGWLQSRVTKSWTLLKQFSTHAHPYVLCPSPGPQRLSRHTPSCVPVKQEGGTRHAPLVSPSLFCMQ